MSYSEYRFQSSALEESRVITTGPGKLFTLIGMFEGVAAKTYLHVFDAAAVPSAGAVPKLILVLRGDLQDPDNFYFDFGSRGIPFTTGIVVAASSTLATYTALGANKFWFYGTRY